MNQALIELQGISKSYYSDTAVTQALRKVSLSFYRGEFVAITGESGGGKSTLLNMIGGMDTFDEGEMFIEGQPTFQYDEEEWEEYRRTKIGYVFQDYSLIGQYTVIENIMSALLVLGYEEETAEKTALGYLEQVGLQGYGTHRASELSSGQKQRLSIARAIAKRTDIIVADEPTGNLDSETGEQIVRLLGELSKDRLVIMVTHNYEQAEPYVTRKIRIHDGQVISDVSSDREETPRQEGGVPEEQPVKRKTMDFKWQHGLAFRFARMNWKCQRGRTVLFTSFLFIVSIVSFLLIGELFMNRDDYKTRNYSHATFYREDDTRLVAKREDGQPLTEADLQEILSLSDVVSADPCDYANDINFYLEKGKDYKFTVSDRRIPSSGADGEMKMVKFLNENRFMMSSEAIGAEDLLAGRMPESQNEIVLYSGDKSVLGTVEPCYFCAHNIWDTGEYVLKEMKVVGLLKEKTEQVYFSRDLCEMLAMNIDSGEFRICFNYDKNFGDYRIKQIFIPVVNEELTGNDVRLSAYMSENAPPAGQQVLHWQLYDSARKKRGEEVTDTVNVLAEKHTSTSDFLEVGREFFDKYYERKDSQVSVYIKSYAKTDSVIRSLENKGFRAISTFRLSANDYVEEKVNSRLVMIGISVFGLLALLAAELLILRSLMKIRIRDYLVLKFIGMKLPVIRKISYYEIGGCTVFSVVLTTAVMWLLRLSGISIIREIMWYYDVSAYILFAVYNFVLAALTVAFFNRLLRGRLNS